MNPIYKSKNNNMTSAMIKEILFQFLFIVYYIYKSFKFYSNVGLYITYIFFTIILTLYEIYCIYSLFVKKYPNHYVWIIVKTSIFLLKVTSIMLDLKSIFIDEFSFELFFQKGLITLLMICLLMIQVEIDLTKFYNYDYFKHYDKEENLIGIVILYIILNPIMIFYYMFNYYIFGEYNLILSITNLIMAMIFILNILMAFSKYTISNLLILISAIIGSINCIHYMVYSLFDNFKASNNEISIKRILLIISTAIALALILYFWSNRHSGKKLIYKRGDYPMSISLFISKRGIFYTDSSNSNDHINSYNNSIGKADEHYDEKDKD